MRRINVILALLIFGILLPHNVYAAGKIASKKIVAKKAGPVKRTLWLNNLWTKEILRVTYRVGADYRPKALARIDHFLRDWRCKKIKKIDPRLIDLLWELAHKLKPKGPIGIVSGYRSPGLNVSLRKSGRKTAKRSQHMEGRAVDVHFPGVSVKRLRAAALAKQAGGVGSYPYSGPPFVHIDIDRVRKWAQRRQRRGSSGGKPKPLKLACELQEEKIPKPRPNPKRAKMLQAAKS